ncbi:MAG: MXAN_5187 C-terminal domain-containing protein [Bradymonadaceae bacterium]
MAADSLSSSEIDGKLQKLESKLDTLRRDYEQFFVDARDRPPRNTRRQVDKLVRDLEQASVTNTSQKFRLRGLVQRYNSYKQKWNRIERQIEEGTYQPHQERAKRRMEDKDDAEQGERQEGRQDGGEQQADDDVVELDVEMDGVDLGDLERELQEMDEAGEFDNYDKTEGKGDGKTPRTERQQNQQGDNSLRRRPPQQADQSGQKDRAAASAQRPGSGGDDAPNKRRDGDTDKDNLREIQDKLGLSSGSDKAGGGGGEDKRQKLKSMRQKLGGDDGRGGNRSSSHRDAESRRSSSSSNAPSGGAKREDLEKLRRAKGDNKKDSGPEPRNKPRRSDSTGSDRESSRSNSGSQRQSRVIDRSSNRGRSSRRDSSDEEDSDDDDDTHAAYLYDHLVATKREHGESTEGLTFEAVRASMHRQIDRLVDDHDCRDADFRVVIKDGGVYLQPVLLD